MIVHNSFLRHMYPPPIAGLSIRLFKQDDKAKVIDLYKRNAFDRFPDGHQTKFCDFLGSLPESFFVTELKDRGIVACGGVVASGDRFHSIYYLLVDPDFQNRGIGSNLAIALIAFATTDNETNFSIIYAVDKSIAFWERFAFSRFAKWEGADGKLYPICVVAYSQDIIRPVKKVLGKRGHLIDPKLPIEIDESGNPFRAVKVDNDRYKIELKQPNI